MAQAAPARTKINTKVTQPAPGRPSRRPAGRPGPGRPPRGPRVSGDGPRLRPAARPPGDRAGVRDTGVPAARPAGSRGGRCSPRTGSGRFRQGATEAKLAAKLEKVTERLRADAANMERPGADLIAHYLDPDRLPGRASGGPASTPTPSGGCASGSPPRSSARSPARTSRPGTCSRSSTPRRRPGKATGCTGCSRPWSPRASRAGTWPARGWPRCTGRPGTARCPRPRVSVAGESALWVDPAEIPSDSDIGKLGRALAAGLHGERDELMASTAAYSGLRWGELTALTIGAGRPGRPRHHRGPQGDRGRRAPVRRGTQVPQVPQDDLPAPHPGRLPARREARRPHRAGPRRAGSRHQPARADLPLARRASTGGPPTSTATSSSAPTWPPAGATRTATAGGPGTACGTCSAPPPCSPGSSTPPTCPAWPGTPTYRTTLLNVRRHHRRRPRPRPPGHRLDHARPR